jgi:hypothetical protein
LREVGGDEIARRLSFGKLMDEEAGDGGSGEEEVEIELGDLVNPNPHEIVVGGHDLAFLKLV